MDEWITVGTRTDRPTEKLPWHVVETLPEADMATIGSWDDMRAAAVERGDRRAVARASIGAALSRYWAHQLLDLGATWSDGARERADLVDEATAIARTLSDETLLVEVLLGRLYACWGPERSARDETLEQLRTLRSATTPTDLSMRIDEWEILERFDHGDRPAATALVDSFEAVHSTDPERDPRLVARRVALWRSNLAMLAGRLDQAVALNESTVSGTAAIAGSPSAFQNVAVVRSIERFLRRGLDDVIEAVRSISASAVRVGSNWDTAVAFTLAETGAEQESRAVFEGLAADDFDAIVPDLNWVVTMHLLGLTAVRLGDRARGEVVLSLLEPHGHFDATHGSGYASYGPNARVLGQLCVLLGRQRDAVDWYDRAVESDAGPWSTLALLERSAVAGRSAEQSLRDVERARTETRAWSMGGWSGAANRRRRELYLTGASGPCAVSDGSNWTLVHPQGSAVLPISTASGLLIRLLRSPGHSWSTAELEGADLDALPVNAPIEAPVDRSALAAYRARISELESRRSTERFDHDDEHELTMLRDELAAARYAASTSAELERSRIRVTTSLRRCIDRIESESPALAGHLRRSVTTGQRCSYSPADGKSWLILVE